MIWASYSTINMEAESSNNENRVATRDDVSPPQVLFLSSWYPTPYLFYCWRCSSFFFPYFQNSAPNNAAVAPENEQPQRQPSRFESFLSVARSLIVRALIIYFISNLFRGKQTPVVQNSTDSSRPARLPAANLFQNGTLFVSIISENLLLSSRMKFYASVSTIIFRTYTYSYPKIHLL